MAWRILICVTLLTVNIYGLTSGNENIIELVKRAAPEKAGPKSIYAPLDQLLRAYLTPDMIAQWKDYGMPIHDILQKMASYYNKNKHGSMSEMLKGVLCQAREMKYFGGKSGKTLDDMIKNIDIKPKCSKKEQDEMLKKIVERVSLDYMLNPKNILDFLQSDLFETYANFIGMPTSEIANIISYAASLTKYNVVSWTLFDIGKRFVCHLSVTNVSAITPDILVDTIKKMTSEPKCSDDELKTKWKDLVTSFGAFIKPAILAYTEYAVTEVNKWPESMMTELKSVDWFAVRAQMKDTIEMINGIATQMFANIQKSSDRKWTLRALMKNFVCGMKITDLTKFDETFLQNWIGRIGNLDVCNKEQEDKAWDNFAEAIAKLYVEMYAPLIKEAEMDFRIIKHMISDDQVRLIQYAIKVIGIKKLDVVIGMVWKNMDKYPKQNLTLDYFMKFLSCHMKESEIDSITMYDMMEKLSKFGQPLPCTPKGDWMQDLFKVLWKLDLEMQLRELDELQKYIGDEFTTEDLKQMAQEATVLKDAIVTSFNKLYTRSDVWINYISTKTALDMAIISQEMICFASKADFATIPKMITSIGDIGACTEDERTKATNAFLDGLAEYNLAELKEFLITLGIFTGQIDMVKMKEAVSKMLTNLHKYSLEIEKMIPQELKDLTIAKIMSAIVELLKPLIDCMRCLSKAFIWLVFEKKDGPTLMECLFPEEVKKMDSGRKEGGNLKDRYKLGFDFPFDDSPVTDKKEALLKLLDFTRGPESDKEKRILKYVTNVCVGYLIDNPTELNEYANNDVYKKRIMEIAEDAGVTLKVLKLMDTKIDKETLEQVKGVRSKKQAQNILKTAFEDMKINSKTPEEKKELIKVIPPGLLKKASADMIDTLYTVETAKELIESFKAEPKSAKKQDGTAEEVDDGQEETESLAEYALASKVMENNPDEQTISLVFGSYLLSVISVSRFKKVPKEKTCLLDMATTEVTTPQIQHILKSCPKRVETVAKTNPGVLGKILTRLPKDVIESLALNELIKVTAEACEYESDLCINREILLANTLQNLDPKIDRSKMSCVLKHVKKEFDLTVEDCKTLGRSMLQKIPANRATFFKAKCMKFLKDKTITFNDMGTMNPYLTPDDIKNLPAATVLQGAVVLAAYIRDASVFNAIAKKISELESFKDASKLTADHVQQASIFIAALADANKIPKESINKVFENLGKAAGDLEREKQECLAEGNEMSDCNKMDSIITKIVDLLLTSIPTGSSRRKRSTDSCSCSNLLSLGPAVLKIPASKISTMICATNFDECMDGLSQIKDWSDEHRKVLVAKAIAIWGQPNTWNSTHMSVASAIIPGLTTDQIKALQSFSRDNAFEVGKQNNWASEKLTETFLLFVKKQLNNNVSATTSFDLQALGKIVCGISVENINKISKESYINAANQIGSLGICSEAQYAAWAAKALQEYGADVSTWGLAEISSVGSVINGFSASNLQKLSFEQIRAISAATIAKILPSKMASLKAAQIGYLTTSQAEMVTSAQKAKMTEEQKNILKTKMIGYEAPPDNGGERIAGTNSMKILTPLILIASKSFVNFLSGV